VRIALGADHAGYHLKGYLVHELLSDGHEPIDLGAFTYDPDDDYPDSALAVAEAVRAGRAERGILVCGSGVGASIAANKVPGIRAALCHDVYTARQSVEHDDANILCIGPRVIGPELIKLIVKVWLEARFSGEERHRRRLGKVLAIEQRYCAAGRSASTTIGSEHHA
jgi:ribose 5-phosphate isomerase B